MAKNGILDELSGKPHFHPWTNEMLTLKSGKLYDDGQVMHVNDCRRYGMINTDIMMIIDKSINEWSNHKNLRRKCVAYNCCD